ncbi:hypothetical protein niasHT_039050 [Heterodera trifolii]|uniref:GST C-terminal domain-containing protein n=1 Tax=Heterodera trifolii TaxID=157864 RepID=A0ABD2HYR8_9BILA
MTEEWKDAVLYAPYQKEQALMDQYADTLAVRAFLMMADLSFVLEQRPNAEFMSPTGEVPFLRLQNALCLFSFHALSIKLGQQQFFVGDQPTELDALAFGHLYTLLTTEMPNKAIVETLSKYPNLIAFCKTIDKEYFSQNF